ncbi:DUF808 domain-containing protein [Gilvimarinus chinensis]|uniref:DUF808 domain-containing protein n=1 Tax=Gilvimarinus chinensis TaxID=396005 RepID=UPI00037E7BD6|nr:DUF808 domain-containing protein [Gilvimarinus chinensis]
MAGSSLLTLIDDIATLLDDVAVMTKVAAKKTAGVLGDDLALNAEQVTGVRADRELPVVWAVFKGSLINKLILVPTALLISAFIPWLIVPLLMLGGAYLCFEGFEKVAHKWLHDKDKGERNHQARLQALMQNRTDMLAFEKTKIKGAIRTDFILSAEIITITLGAVSGAALSSQIAVLSIIALGMTLGVYGLVAAIVKMDDAGLHLSGQASVIKQKLGQFLLAAAPKLMKFLSIAGTAAMFLVGGGILVHGIGPAHHFVEHLALKSEALPTWGAIVGAMTPTLINALVGIVAGALLVGAITVSGKLFSKTDAQH